MQETKQSLNYTISSDVDTYIKDMRKLLYDENSCDICFSVEDKDGKAFLYKAHKQIIYARCDYLALLIQENEKKMNNNPSTKKEGKIMQLKIDCASPAAIGCLLEFIYSNSATLENKSTEELVDILDAANEFNMRELQMLTEKYILKILKVSNAAKIMAAAIYFGSDDFREFVISYIIKNARNVFKGDDAEKIPGAAMVRIISSEELKLDEIEVVAIVRKWALTQSFIGNLSLLEAAKPIAGQIRLNLLSKQDLLTVEELNKKDPFIPHEFIMEAWKNIALGKRQNTPRKSKIVKSKEPSACKIK